METELPTMSICPKTSYIDSGYGLSFKDIATSGKFVPPPNLVKLNQSLDDIFNELYNDVFYLLDVTGKIAEE